MLIPTVLGLLYTLFLFCGFLVILVMNTSLNPALIKSVSFSVAMLLIQGATLTMMKNEATRRKAIFLSWTSLALTLGATIWLGVGIAQAS
jgi:hypothetical protein